MTKEIYIKEAEDCLAHAKATKKEGGYYFSIKMHMISKIDGIAGIAIHDNDLSVEEYKEISDRYSEIQDDLWKIQSDTKPEIEL